MGQVISWQDAISKPEYCIKVSDLPLPARAANGLSNENIVYTAELAQKAKGELLRVHNFGRESLHGVQAILEKLGLELDTFITGIPQAEEASEILREANESFQARIVPLIAKIRADFEEDVFSDRDPLKTAARQLLGRLKLSDSQIKKIENNSELSGAIKQMLDARDVCKRHLDQPEISKILNDEHIVRAALHALVPAGHEPK